MKYISKEQLLESLNCISFVNQFFGLTFLAAKKSNLPVGEMIPVSLDSLNRDFLEKYYKLDPRSDWYFRTSKYNNKDQFWLRPDYYGKGLQKMNTTTFKDAFIHKHNTNEWGWNEKYVDFLVGKLTNGKKIQTFHFATWFFRSLPFEQQITRDDIIERFYKEFNISQEEREKLFDDNFLTEIELPKAFSEDPVSWKEIAQEYRLPPDVAPDQGGILTYLGLIGVGPVNPLAFEPGTRLNIITGDNGLGKTFILESAWWALTGTWAEREALPSRVHGLQQNAKINYLLMGELSHKLF